LRPYGVRYNGLMP